jgi:hypothetical protein
MIEFKKSILIIKENQRVGGWQENVKEHLSKVKPISNIIIRNEQDIYNILINREKFEYLLQEYERNQLEEQEQVCCDENTPCVPNVDDSHNKQAILSISTTIEPLAAARKEQQQLQQQDEDNSHRGENPHSKITEQKTLKQNQQSIIDFLLDNKDLIRVEDLKIYEPAYKCYREKGNCIVCTALTNIICKNCHHDKELWLCTNHWQEHAIEKHTQLIR